MAATRFQIAVAEAVETCWLTMAEKQRLEAVAAAAQRQRAGQRQRRGEARLDRGEPGRALGDVGVGLDDPSDHAFLRKDRSAESRPVQARRDETTGLRRSLP